MQDPCINLRAFKRDICQGCRRNMAKTKGWKKLGKRVRPTALAEADMRLLSFATIGRRKG
ncbi:MAG: DUF1289 domain-containing protein [Pseudomonas sp.]|uniref:DUF1289 domain-containing protein n=1 Tax=Pseudomonas sp. TaxID=306 RepID=UPI00398261CB